MNRFDKICAVIAVLMGLPLLVFGVIGLFAGCSAHFTLPPILGVLPGLAGWGICKSVYIAWKIPPSSDGQGFEVAPPT